MAFVEQLVDIAGVEVVGEYRLRLTFEDGTVGDVDFAGREWRGVFEPLNDPAEFARVEVDPEAGTISWPGASTWPPSRSTPTHVAAESKALKLQAEQPLSAARIA